VFFPFTLSEDFLRLLVYSYSCNSSFTRPSFDIRNTPGASPEMAMNKLEEMKTSKEARISNLTRLAMLSNVPGN